MKYVNHHHGCSGFVPTRADGSEWAHLLVLNNGAVVHADTETEALESLIPGYATLTRNDVDARRRARIGHAERMAAAVQQRRIDTAISDGRLNPADPDDALLISILQLPKSEPMLLASPESPGVQTPWEGPVGLILVSTSYAPHTDTPPAIGRVSWLDPDDERAYLESLRDVGLSTYWAAQPATGAAG
ncbi:MAG: hypothetical protein IPL37_13995 [Austwickia sp.]|nr:hypothetical protein [Austwickia sp.]